MKTLTMQLLFLFILSTGISQPAVQNLGSKVNSIYSEARPTISPDGKTLYFIVEGSPTHRFYKKDKVAQDVWMTESDTDGNWKQAVQLSKLFNDKNHSAIFWISPDGRSLQVRGAYNNGKYTKRGLSLMHMTDSGWSKPERVQFKDYSTMSNGAFTGATMSLNGKVLILYFSDDRSYVNDLYVSRLDSVTNTYSSPVKLSGNISLDDYDEISPYIALDDYTMYFSSNRPGGQGGYDIWMTHRLDDTWTNWSDPVNLGDTINTADWEAYFTVDFANEYAYFATTHKSLGGTDLVKIKLSDWNSPKPYLNVHGNIFDASNDQLMPANLLFTSTVNLDIRQKSTFSSSYNLIMPYGGIYTLDVKFAGYYPATDSFCLVKKEAYRVIHRDIYLTPIPPQPIEEAPSLSGNTVLFDYGKAYLRSEAYKALDNLIKVMKANPNKSIELAAFTDTVGSVKYNLQLSQDRANAVKEYLISQGIDSNRITAKGYGEADPMTSNSTDEGRQLNRRVEFRLSDK